MQLEAQRLQQRRFGGHGRGQLVDLDRHGKQQALAPHLAPGLGRAQALEGHALVRGVLVDQDQLALALADKIRAV